jgi:hypothetical protein
MFSERGGLFAAKLDGTVLTWLVFSLVVFPFGHAVLHRALFTVSSFVQI